MSHGLKPDDCLLDIGSGIGNLFIMDGARALGIVGRGVEARRPRDHRDCAKRYSRVSHRVSCSVMEDDVSQRNGDTARFQKDRKRKLLNRDRSRALVAALAVKPVEDASGATTRAASLAMHDEGGPTRAED